MVRLKINSITSYQKRQKDTLRTNYLNGNLKLTQRMNAGYHVTTTYCTCWQYDHL